MHLYSELESETFPLIFFYECGCKFTRQVWMSFFSWIVTAINQPVKRVFSAEADSKTGRRQQILVYFCGQKRGNLSLKRTLVDIYGWAMPVERFEPSTPHGDLFLRQARIPFRHTGLWVAWYPITCRKSICSAQRFRRYPEFPNIPELLVTSLE